MRVDVVGPTHSAPVIAPACGPVPIAVVHRAAVGLGEARLAWIGELGREAGGGANRDLTRDEHDDCRRLIEHGHDRTGCRGATVPVAQRHFRGVGARAPVEVTRAGAGVSRGSATRVPPIAIVDRACVLSAVPSPDPRTWSRRRRECPQLRLGVTVTLVMLGAVFAVEM